MCIIGKEKKQKSWVATKLGGLCSPSPWPRPKTATAASYFIHFKSILTLNLESITRMESTVRRTFTDLGLHFTTLASLIAPLQIFFHVRSADHQQSVGFSNIVIGCIEVTCLIADQWERIYCDGRKRSFGLYVKKVINVVVYIVLLA